MSSQQQASTTPIDARDEWRTPSFVFAWANRRFGFGVDLAATDENALCDDWFTREHSAFFAPWHEFSAPGWANPPYSNIDPWLHKAVDEARAGFTSVFLVLAPNGEERYGKYVLGVASELIFITGRLAYLTPDGRPVSGNTRGSCLVVYRGHDLGNTRYYNVARDAMRQEATAA